MADYPRASEWEETAMRTMTNRKWRIFLGCLAAGLGLLFWSGHASAQGMGGSTSSSFGGSSFGGSGSSGGTSSFGGGSSSFGGSSFGSGSGSSFGSSSFG